MSAGPEVEIYTALIKDNGVNFARQALPVAVLIQLLSQWGLILKKAVR